VWGIGFDIVVVVVVAAADTVRQGMLINCCHFVVND
jgi:hypothetical protein